jgi:hypothetical protein
MRSSIQIRFNTDRLRDESAPAWRVIQDGVERLASSISITAPCWTTRDVMASGLTKWHISCDGVTSWDGHECTIEARKSIEQVCREDVLDFVI